jgi:hypothetical protein
MARNDYTAAEDAMIAKLPPAEVSRRTGRSLKSIGKRRVMLKRRGHQLPDLRFTDARLRFGRSVWTPAVDKLVRQHRPYIVARKLGVSPATVARRRAALGMPPIGQHRVPKKPRVRDAYRKWTKRELDIALSLPPRESVKLLPGRSKTAIETVRCLRKRAGLKVNGVKGWPYPPRKAKQR